MNEQAQQTLKQVTATTPTAAAQIKIAYLRESLKASIDQLHPAGLLLLWCLVDNLPQAQVKKAR
jgi:hypothetical protein